MLTCLCSFLSINCAVGWFLCWKKQFATDGLAVTTVESQLVDISLSHNIHFTVGPYQTKRYICSLMY